MRGQTEGLPKKLAVNDYNAERMAAQARMTKDELLGGLSKQREKTVALFNKFSEAELQLVGRHPVFGQMSVNEIMANIAHHDEHARYCTSSKIKWNHS